MEKKFKNIDSLDDLLNEINTFVDSNNDEGKIKHFTSKEIRFYSDIKNDEKLYHSFEVLKKSGAKRVISAPDGRLKLLQVVLNKLLQDSFEFPVYVTGFVKSKSIVDNASLHVGKSTLINVDLKDFFPSIEFWRVKKNLVYHLKMNEKIATIIANLCCYKGVLPQGAPTSPFLSNLVCVGMDYKLKKLGRTYKCTYSRYADDISFSSFKNFQLDNFLIEIKKIVKKYGFYLNDKKSRKQNRGYRQEVTGLIVNQKVNVRRSYLSEIRFYLNLWENYGEKETEKYLTKNYTLPHNKGRYLKNVIGGKLMFLKMVKGENDLVYRKYNDKFIKLAGVKKQSDNSFNIILETLKNNGLEKAMQLYKNGRK